MTGTDRITIDREFATHLLDSFGDPEAHGVHHLFNLWWRFAPEAVKAKYVADFRSRPDQRRWVEEGYLSQLLDLEALAALPAHSLGRHYCRFIVENRFEAKIALNYRAFHERLAASGALSVMPPEIDYAVLRGFQTHDFLHVATGYGATPGGEIALQAFSLAQLRFPYFAMWMSVMTTRMTFHDPDIIGPLMDDIADGWQFGRRARNVSFLRWEDMLERPLDEIRRDYGLLRHDGEACRRAA